MTPLIRYSLEMHTEKYARRNVKFPKSLEDKLNLVFFREWILSSFLNYILSLLELKSVQFSIPGILRRPLKHWITLLGASALPFLENNCILLKEKKAQTTVYVVDYGLKRQISEGRAVPSFFLIHRFNIISAHTFLNAYITALLFQYYMIRVGRCGTKG